MELFAGRYALVDPIGDGGMGSVWRAFDAKRRRYVAVKLLRPSDASSLLRFVREQSLRVDHPHVVAPSSWAADDDKVLLAMDLVRGGSVEHLLGDYGALPLEYIAVLIDQLLDALVTVHAHGIVHRDVKPANLLLEPTGRARPVLRLSDFGIAAVIGEPRLTNTELVIGTPGYVAPECARGGRPDPRQDLYSVGVVLIQMLTGEPPPASKDGIEPVFDEAPDAMKHVISALSAADPVDRPASAARARELWREALAACDIGTVDPTDPDAVEVFAHVEPLPEGFGPDGPTATAAANAGTRPDPASEQPTVKLTGEHETQPVPMLSPLTHVQPVSGGGGVYSSLPPATSVWPRAAVPRRGTAPDTGTRPSGGRRRAPSSWAPTTWDWDRIATFIALVALGLGSALLTVSVLTILLR